MSRFPGYRGVDIDGDVLMADAHPGERSMSPQEFHDTTMSSRSRGYLRPSAAPIFTREAANHPANDGRPPARVSTSSDQRNFTASPFGNHLRHLPPPNPSRMNNQQRYPSAAMFSPSPGGARAPSLPPLSSVFPGSWEGFEYVSVQSRSFGRDFRTPTIDLTQVPSSPVTQRTRDSLEPIHEGRWQSGPRPLDQAKREEDLSQIGIGHPDATSFDSIFHPAFSARHIPPPGVHYAPPRLATLSPTPLHVHRRRLTRPLTPKVACTACLEEFKRDDLLQLACNCRYCTPCLNLSFQAGCANMASFPPKCCGKPLRISVWGSMLEHDVLERYKKIEAEFGANRPLYCAQPKCSRFIPEGDILSQQEVGVCPQCVNSTCVQCRRLMNDHPVWDIEERVCPANEENLTKLFELGSEKKWKQCPTCLNMVEKTEGCNHMDCICGVEFCYRCGKLFDEDDACECDPNTWDDDGEDDDDEDEDEEDEDDDDEESDEEEWPDFRAAVDPAGRPKCLHLHTAPLGTNQFTCHGCLRLNHLLTCEDCALELCQSCVDKIRNAADSDSDEEDEDEDEIEYND